MKKGMRLTAVLMMLASFLFAGCGSSGGGDDPTPPPVPTTVAVESVSLDKTALTLKTGEDGTLAATVLPKDATDKSVTWNSDNETVATVDQNGKVHAVAPGTATITVKTNDGAKTAVCAVTVADEVYTVSFNMNGHGTQLDNQTVAKNGKIVKPTDPTEAGVNFHGWYKEASYTNKWDFDTDTVTADMTLYAKWVNAYTVSFVANGGEGTMDDISVEEGGDCTVLASAFTEPVFTAKAGAVPATHENFAGWNTKSDGTGTAYAAGDTISAVTSDMTLYAQWAKPYFSVSDTKKVYFAKGNLYWDGSSFKMENTQSATTPATGGSWSVSHVSHFYWSKKANVAYAEYYSDSTSATEDTFFAENGGAIEGWDVLSGGHSGEWYYLFNTRTDAAKKVGQGTVCEVKGIILLPDVFTDPMKNEGTEEFVPSTTGYTANIYTSDNWAAMEWAGAVFLPAAGYRYEDYIYNETDGYYCSSTPYGSDENFMYSLFFYDGNVSSDAYNQRCDGCSVRLVVEEN